MYSCGLQTKSTPVFFVRECARCQLSKFHLFQAATRHIPPHSTSLSKQELKSLLSVCKSDRERACMRYAVFKASGFSATHARKQFGFQNISKQVKDVEDALK